MDNVEAVAVANNSNECDVFVEHPLLNPVILQNIFKYGSNRDLQNSRLVNHLWHKESNKFWAANKTFILRGKLELRNPRSNWETDNDVDMETFYKAITTSETEMLQFSGRLHCKTNKFFCMKINEESLFIDYFANHSTGEWLRILVLAKIIFEDMTSFMKIVRCNYTPKLKELCIQGRFNFQNFEKSRSNSKEMETWRNVKSLAELAIFVDHETLTELPLNWTQLLTAFPNLHTLKLEATRIGLQEVTKMLQATIDAKVTRTRQTESRVIAKIKILFIIARDNSNNNRGISIQLGKRFEQSNIRFVGLALKLNETKLKVVKMILNKSRCDLCALHLQRDRSFLLSMEGIPCMPNLKILRLGNNAMLRTLNVLKNMPTIWSLEFLGKIHAYDFVNMMEATKVGDLDAIRIRTKSGIKQLTCSSTRNCDVETIYKLICVMPNLTVLDMKMKVDTDIFRDICCFWPHLEKIVLWQHSLNDQAITGQLNKEMINRPFHNITNLKKLTSFRICWDEEIDEPPFADISWKSFVYGFLVLPKLKTLHLPVFKMHHLILGAMNKRIGDFLITVKNGKSVKRTENGGVHEWFHRR